jgi:hypothetical protein
MSRADSPARRFAVLSALFVLGGCASAGRAPIAPLATLRECPVECRGTIGTDQGVADAGAELGADEESGKPRATFAATVRLTRLPTEVADALLGGFSFARAVVVASEQLPRAIAAASELSVERPIATPDGRAGDVVDVTEISYIDRFDFTTYEACAIADPSVGIFQTGQRLTIVPRRDADSGAWDVAIRLESADAPRDTPLTSVRLLDIETPIEIQLPVLGRLTTTTRTRLAEGEALIVVAPELLHRDRSVLAVIEPRSAAKEGGGGGGHAATAPALARSE